jgi:hypothetical protein
MTMESSLSMEMANILCVRVFIAGMLKSNIVEKLVREQRSKVQGKEFLQK